MRLLCGDASAVWAVGCWPTATALQLCSSALALHLAGSWLSEQRVIRTECQIIQKAVHLGAIAATAVEIPYLGVTYHHPSHPATQHFFLISLIHHSHTAVGSYSASYRQSARIIFHEVHTASTLRSCIAYIPRNCVSLQPFHGMCYISSLSGQYNFSSRAL